MTHNMEFHILIVIFTFAVRMVHMMFFLGLIFVYVFFVH